MVSASAFASGFLSSLPCRTAVWKCEPLNLVLQVAFK